MSFTKARPEDASLSRQDKLKRIRLLAQGSEATEAPIIEANCTYPIWSPTEAHSAAATMLRVLEEEKG